MRGRWGGGRTQAGGLEPASRGRTVDRRAAVLAVLASFALLAVVPAFAEVAFDRVDVRLPGTLLDATAVRLSDGRVQLAVLVAEPDPGGEGGEGGGADADAGATRDAGSDRNGDGSGPGEEGSRTGGADAASGGEDGSSGDPGGADGSAGGGASADEEAADRPRSLLLVDARSGRTRLLAADLPPGSRRLAVAARDRAADLLIIDGDETDLVVDPAAARGRWRPLDALGPASLSLVDPSGLGQDDGAAPLAVAGAGRLVVAAPAATGGALSPAAVWELPRRAERKPWGLRITSPPVHAVAAEGDGGPPCWAAGPEAVGKRRLRTLLFCAGEAEPLEAWSLLPAEEAVTRAFYLRHGGRPLLAALTADKVGLFVKQRLRVFPLAASRNRVGAAPLLAADTECPMWHASNLGLADADGDGRNDLYLVCTKGLVDQELRLEVHRGDGDGGFEARGRAVELDGEYASWHFGRDWTGDGLPDLVAVRDNALHVHAGSGRRRPADKRPHTVVELAPAADGPGFDVAISAGGSEDTDGVHIRIAGPRILGAADLAGDARPDLVILRQGAADGVLAVLAPR